MADNLTNKSTVDLIKILKSKIDFKRISARRVRCTRAADMVLAHALKYIELLCDGHITSYNAEKLTYREIVAKLRRKEPTVPWRSPNARRERPDYRRYVNQSAIELIDYFIERNAKGKAEDGPAEKLSIQDEFVTKKNIKVKEVAAGPDRGEPEAATTDNRAK
ncbi:hypothetical protein LTR84_012273 [Exophiala bonariae]|uniref:Uncharacterized protein n=1 Tax=Exophiala bonariae TaxID=1690606 RepID=A0AAV9NJE4_9EURO|nr:hypothetical protein LTR84_012273 [Exophiala bonariae]